MTQGGLENRTKTMKNMGKTMKNVAISMDFDGFSGAPSQFITAMTSTATMRPMPSRRTTTRAWPTQLQG